MEHKYFDDSNKEDKTKRYHELQELLSDYGLICNVKTVKQQTKLYIKTDDPNEEYTKVYDDDNRESWTDLAKNIINDYVSTLQYI